MLNSYHPSRRFRRVEPLQLGERQPLTPTAMFGLELLLAERIQSSVNVRGRNFCLTLLWLHKRMFVPHINH